MKLTLALFIFAFMDPLAVIAQCPDPGWERPSCQVTDWGCYPDESCFFLGGYFSEITIQCSGYDPSIGQFNSCQYNYGGCTNACIPPNSAAAKPSWRFDPVTMVMNLFPRIRVDLLPIGRNGRCARVVRRKL